MGRASMPCLPARLSPPHHDRSYPFRRRGHRGQHSRCFPLPSRVHFRGDLCWWGSPDTAGCWRRRRLVGTTPWGAGALANRRCTACSLARRGQGAGGRGLGRACRLAAVADTAGNIAVSDDYRRQLRNRAILCCAGTLAQTAPPRDHRPGSRASPPRWMGPPIGSCPAEI